MALEWTEKLAVGHDLIDQQHRELFRRFDDLLEACQQAKGKERIESLLGFLGTYVVTHFQAEERLMERHGYPGAEAHKAEHSHFTGRLDLLREDLRSGGASTQLVISTNQTLLHWILNHIKSVDVELGAFLRRKGIPPA
jgi:hemerythrin